MVRANQTVTEGDVGRGLDAAKNGQGMILGGVRWLDAGEALSGVVDSRKRSGSSVAKLVQRYFGQNQRRGRPELSTVYKSSGACGSQRRNNEVLDVHEKSIVENPRPEKIGCD